MLSETKGQIAIFSNRMVDKHLIEPLQQGNWKVDHQLWTVSGAPVWIFYILFTSLLTTRQWPMAKTVNSLN